MLLPLLCSPATSGRAITASIGLERPGLTMKSLSNLMMAFEHDGQSCCNNPAGRFVRGQILMKHTLHGAQDLMIAYTADMVLQELELHVEWVDSGLVEWALKFGLLSEINRELETMHSTCRVESLSHFKVVLTVANKARFTLHLVERDFEPRQTTLVLLYQE